MMLGPQVFLQENVPENVQKNVCAQVTEVRDEQERIASLLVAILVLGIGAGSFLSYPIVNSL